jgi:Mce-associated membrane protein
VLLLCAVAAASGLMLWHHEQVVRQHARDAEFVRAAESGVVALLSIDHNHAKADVERIIAASTGTFRDDFSRDADSWVKTAEDSKTVTKGSISAAALENVTGDSAVVLLTASSKVTNANGAQEDPRAWRMSVTVVRDGDQLKMSNVEFVP